MFHSLSERLRALPVWGKIGVGCGGALALLLVCGCLLVGIGAAVGKPPAQATATSAPITQAPTRAPTATSISSTPTSSASPTTTSTATPILPTATPRPVIVTGAVIGGLLSAFQSKYGSPSGNGTAKSYHFTLQGQAGIVTATPSADTSSDGKNHVDSLRIGPPSGSWDQATADSVCKSFLPADAQFQRDQVVAGYGNEHVYLSADLSVTFPAGDFTDGTTLQPVPPGTFSIESGPGWPLNTGCIIILGS